MKDRILASLVLWTLIIGMPALFGNVGAFLLIAVFGTATFIELAALLTKARQPIDRTTSTVLFAGLMLGLIFVPPWIMPPFGLVAIGLGVAAIVMLLTAPAGQFSQRVAASLGAVMLILLPFSSLLLLVHENGMALPVWIIAVTKFCDVGALLAGKWFGRHKLSPVLSPRKTWEGLAGGILLSVVVSILIVGFFSPFFPASLSIAGAAVAAVPIAIAGVFGDLMESAFKREAEVKDSGTTIPGIGGFFDLCDSLLLALPIGYFFVWLLV